MNKPDISWFVKEQDDVYVAHTDYYAGNCNSHEDFILNLEVWNNKWNTEEDIEDVTNSKLALSFESAEDSVLFSICKVKINEGAYESLNTDEFNRAIIKLGNISGKKNNGLKTNVNNYKKISIKFENVPNNLKSGLKSLFVDIQYENE